MLIANMDGFMNNSASVTFFRGVCDQDPNSDSQKSLACYELCRKILYNGMQVNDEEKDKLIEFCPNFEWEQELEAALDNNDIPELQHFLNKMMAECKFTIENSNDYHRYKELLRDKCKGLKLK